MTEKSKITFGEVDWNEEDSLVYCDPKVHTLEKHMIPPEQWEQHLDKFPDNVRQELEYVIRWKKGLEEYMPHPIGIGWHEDAGWFALASGQGPCIIWTEKEFK